MSGCQWKDCPREGAKLFKSAGLPESWLCDEHFRETLNLTSNFQSEFSNSWTAHLEHLALSEHIPLSLAKLISELQFWGEARTQIRKIDDFFKETGRQRTIPAIAIEVAKLLSNDGETTFELEERILPIVVQYFADHGYDKES